MSTFAYREGQNEKMIPWNLISWLKCVVILFSLFYIAKIFLQLSSIRRLGQQSTSLMIFCIFFSPTGRKRRVESKRHHQRMYSQWNQISTRTFLQQSHWNGTFISTFFTFFFFSLNHALGKLLKFFCCRQKFQSNYKVIIVLW